MFWRKNKKPAVKFHLTMRTGCDAAKVLLKQKEEALAYFNAIWAAVQKHNGVDPACRHWPHFIRGAIMSDLLALHAMQAQHDTLLEALAGLEKAGYLNHSPCASTDGATALFRARKALEAYSAKQKSATRGELIEVADGE